MEEYFICACFFERHIYLKKYTLHVNYYNDEGRFVEEYEQVLKARHSKCDLQQVIDEVKLEVERRKQRGKEHVQRCCIVREKYIRLHPALYVLNDSFLHPQFLDIVKYCTSPNASSDGLTALVNVEKGSRIYSLPIFTNSFCQQFLEELDNFESADIPKGRPNTMNNTGLGFCKGFLDKLVLTYLQPLAKLLYPECVGAGLDSHRSHIVHYVADGNPCNDVGLSYHYDNAEVTLNVALGKDFTDGELYFGEMKDDLRSDTPAYSYTQVIGRGVLHRGQHMHGALDISDGQRYNLVIWMRSSSVRNKCCPRCDSVPQLLPFEGYGDGFTQQS